MLTLQFDGLYRGVPQNLNLNTSAGFMCYGWVIVENEEVIARGHGGYLRGKDASSNVAEYLGLIEGLEALLDMGAAEELVTIRGDAKSVIDQMLGEAMVSASSIKPLHRRARKLAAQFKRAQWNWAPRRYNQEADALTRRALRQLKANPRQYEEALTELEGQCRKGRQMKRLMPVMDLRMYRAAGKV